MEYKPAIGTLVRIKAGRFAGRTATVVAHCSPAFGDHCRVELMKGPREKTKRVEMVAIIEIEEVTAPRSET